MSEFRFRPRYRGVAWTSIGVGGGLAGTGIAMGLMVLPVAAGAFGIGLGLAYLLAGSWKYRIVTDDDGIEVRDQKGTRFRLLWSEIKRVVASPSTKTCFIDGGMPEHSILVPGVGAPAPYSISDSATLFAEVLAHVAPDRVKTVETLEQSESVPKTA
ncbi:MAG: hypothetical protein H0T46_03880 [Deltaproteobacteria bacterium]|nr:hypothetical protein [Deltaproteobacteria bacterium]